MTVTFVVDLRDLVIPVPVGYQPDFTSVFSASESDNYMVSLTIANITKERSEGMNKKFHAMCGELAKSAGDGTKGTKDYIKEMVKSMAVDYYGYPQARNENGDLRWDDEGNPIGASTANATPAQFTMLMDALRMLAEQYGYSWRDDNG